jgi:lipopolysaccharide/colanic/teichoic acid biosynthesis glycosyltransferase
LTEDPAQADEPQGPVSIPSLKRATDIVVSFLALIVLLPLFFFIACLIKLEGLFDRRERGSVLRHEIRISEGRPFRFYKFRFIKQRVLDEEPTIRRRDRAKSLERDENCTRVGRVLKRCYLDELPQLYNVLRGDMTLVGPRPFPEDDYKEDLGRGDFRKKVIRAGLTGLVQFNKGVDTGKTDREMDNEYIIAVRRMGSVRWWLYDLGILLKTVRTVFQAKGI